MLKCMLSTVIYSSYGLLLSKSWEDFASRIIYVMSFLYTKLDYPADINLSCVLQCVVGGTNVQTDVKKLRDSTPHILVGTPGRLIDLLENSILKGQLQQLRTFVLDEADRLLDMGFRFPFCQFFLSFILIILWCLVQGSWMVLCGSKVCSLCHKKAFSTILFQIETCNAYEI